MRERRATTHSSYEGRKRGGRGLLSDQGGGGKKKSQEKEPLQRKGTRDDISRMVRKGEKKGPSMSRIPSRKGTHIKGGGPPCGLKSRGEKVPSRLPTSREEKRRTVPSTEMDARGTIKGEEGHHNSTCRGGEKKKGGTRGARVLCERWRKTRGKKSPSSTRFKVLIQKDPLLSTLHRRKSALLRLFEGKEGGRLSSLQKDDGLSGGGGERCVEFFLFTEIA